MPKFEESSLRSILFLSRHAKALATDSQSSYEQVIESLVAPLLVKDHETIDDQSSTKRLHTGSRLPGNREVKGKFSATSLGGNNFSWESCDSFDCSDSNSSSGSDKIPIAITTESKQKTVQKTSGSRQSCDLLDSSGSKSSSGSEKIQKIDVNLDSDEDTYAETHAETNSNIDTKIDAESISIGDSYSDINNETDCDILSMNMENFDWDVPNNDNNIETVSIESSCSEKSHLKTASHGIYHGSFVGSNLMKGSLRLRKCSGESLFRFKLFYTN